MSETFEKSQMSDSFDVPAGCPGSSIVAGTIFHTTRSGVGGWGVHTSPQSPYAQICNTLITASQKALS